MMLYDLLVDLLHGMVGFVGAPLRMYSVSPNLDLDHELGKPGRQLTVGLVLPPTIQPRSFPQL